MKILDQRAIDQKTKRLAIEILERNFGEEEIILAGINNNGLEFAQMLLTQLLGLQADWPEERRSMITLTRIRLNPANPVAGEIHIEMPIEYLRDKAIILVDDVANTGRTVFFATKPLFETLPKRVEVAVLVDRKHKSFPILVDYVGLSLNTTLQENIDVQIRGVEEAAVFLS